MAKEPCRTIWLRYQGLFDFEGLYRHMVSFFDRRKYDYIEKKWKEKDASPVGREITVDMAPERNVTEYIIYRYEMQIKSIDTHKVEVVRDGKTVKLTHARFQIKIGGHVQVDWQNYGKGHEKLASFFKDTVMRREINKVHVTALEQEMQQLHDSIQGFLNMEASRTQKEVYSG